MLFGASFKRVAPVDKNPKRSSGMLDATILKKLKGIVEANYVLTRKEDLVTYSYDGTFLEHWPDVVVLPADIGQVSAVMRLAHMHQIPVVPRGTGTGLAGGSMKQTSGRSINMRLRIFG